MKHLYKGKAKITEKRKFKKRYGKKGLKIYGATVGKVKREREAKRKKRK